MIKSESIKNIGAALVKLQSEIGKAKKDKENPFFKSNYADLESIADVSKEALTKNNLAISQTMGFYENKEVVETTLIHSLSGEFITSMVPIINKKGDMQGLGSAITYARRYGKAAILDIVQEDDDGNGASQKPDSKTKEPEKKPEKPIDVNVVLENISIISTKEAYEKAVKYASEIKPKLQTAENDAILKALDQINFKLNGGK